MHSTRKHTNTGLGVPEGCYVVVEHLHQQALEAVGAGRAGALCERAEDGLRQHHAQRRAVPRLQRRQRVARWQHASRILWACTRVPTFMVQRVLLPTGTGAGSCELEVYSTGLCMRKICLSSAATLEARKVC